MPLFGFIYSYFAPIYHFGPDLALFIDIFQYLVLFTYIYPHLPLVIFTLNCHYLTYMPYILHIYILLVRPHDRTYVQNINAIIQLIMEILHLILGDHNLTLKVIKV